MNTDDSAEAEWWLATDEHRLTQIIPQAEWIGHRTGYGKDQPVTE